MAGHKSKKSKVGSFFKNMFGGGGSKHHDAPAAAPAAPAAPAAAPQQWKAAYPAGMVPPNQRWKSAYPAGMVPPSQRWKPAYPSGRMAGPPSGPAPMPPSAVMGPPSGPAPMPPSMMGPPSGPAPMPPVTAPAGRNRTHGSQTFSAPASTAFVTQVPYEMTFGKAHRYASGVRQWEDDHNAARQVVLDSMSDEEKAGGGVATSRGRSFMKTGDDDQSREENREVMRLLIEANRAGKNKEMAPEDYNDLKTLLTPYMRRVSDADVNSLLASDEGLLRENLPQLDELRQSSMYVSDLMKNALAPGKQGGDSKVTMFDELAPTQEEQERFNKNRLLMDALYMKSRGLLLGQLQRKTEEVAPGSGPNLNPMYFTRSELSDKHADTNTNAFIDNHLERGDRFLKSTLATMKGPNSHYNVWGNR